MKHIYFLLCVLFFLFLSGCGAARTASPDLAAAVELRTCEADDTELGGFCAGFSARIHDSARRTPLWETLEAAYGGMVWDAAHTRYILLMTDVSAEMQDKLCQALDELSFFSVNVALVQCTWSLAALREHYETLRQAFPDTPICLRVAQNRLAVSDALTAQQIRKTGVPDCWERTKLRLPEAAYHDEAEHRAALAAQDDPAEAMRASLLQLSNWYAFFPEDDWRSRALYPLPVAAGPGAQFRAVGGAFPYLSIGRDSPRFGPLYEAWGEAQELLYRQVFWELTRASPDPCIYFYIPQAELP